MKFLKLLEPYESIPILAIALFVVILISFQAYQAAKGKKISGLRSDTILFLGFLSLSWGIICQLMGLFHAAGVVVLAGEISPSLIWAGLRISLIPIIMGFVILFVSSIGWFLLRPFRKPAN